MQNKKPRIELRYCVGDYCLFRVSFSARVDHASFDPNAAPLTLPDEVPDVPAGVSVHCSQGRRIAGRLPVILTRRNGLCYIRNQTANYYIDLNNTFEVYLQSFSSKTRTGLQRKVRKVAALEGGTADCREFRTPEEAVEFHALARQIAVKTYQERLFDGAIPDTAEFVERMRSLAAADSFRGYILFVNGRPAAYLYLPAEGDVLVYGYLGYDPEFAEWSPGTVLLYLALERVFAERRFRYFDFTYGENQTKSVFGRSHFLRADLYVFRWSLRNALAVYGHVTIDACSSAIGRCLDALGARQRVRRLLRHA